MTNHPTRNKYRYFYICPRGFSNEVAYYRIPAERAHEIETHFAGRKDEEFDAGNTNWDWDWTRDRRATVAGVAVDWDDAIYENRALDRDQLRNEAAE